MQKTWLYNIIPLMLALFTGEPASPDDGVNTFYQTLGRPIAWSCDSCQSDLQQLSAYISQAPYLGLNNQHYERAVIDSLAKKSYPDTLVDRQITRAALLFFADVAYGQTGRIYLKYNGPGYMPHCLPPVAQILANSMLQKQFHTLLNNLEPADTVYRQFKTLIGIVQQQIADSNFRDILLPGRLSALHEPGLLARLYQLGFAENTSDTALALRRAQSMFGLMADGNLRSTFIDALNVPLRTRREQLYQGINCYRWLRCAQQTAPAVIVNIPSNSLSVYFRDSCLLSSRVIVGKPATPTPVLCSRITSIVLYPYWYVPRKIAVRELLPRIKANRNYLVENQLEILNQHGKIVSPSGIDWPNVNAANFPYTLRQNTGCDNSLGVIKLDFESPYGVYLHDTPQKGLFLLRQRFFSHGCVRVERADTLARLLAADKYPMVAARLAAGATMTQVPIPIPMDTPPWVYILYNIAWPDENGQVRFFTDAYQHYNSANKKKAGD